MASLSLTEIVVILIVVVGIGWGIWFEYRPDDKIKKEETADNNERKEHK